MLVYESVGPLVASRALKHRGVGVRFTMAFRDEPLKTTLLLSFHCSVSRVPDTRRIYGPSVIVRRDKINIGVPRSVFSRQNELEQKPKTDLFRNDRTPFKCWHAAVNYCVPDRARRLDGRSR